MNSKVNRKTNSYTVAAFYNSYLDNIEPDTLYDIPYEKYRAIINDYFKFLREQLLYRSRGIRLPYRLGKVSIVKHKPKHFDPRSLRKDYQASKQYGKPIFFTNEHSDFYKFRCYWDKTNMLVKNKTHYQLVLTRANKRELAQIIKNKICDYQEL